LAEMAASLTSVAGADPSAIHVASGAAPVTKRSGKSRIVTRRLACNPRLRNALYHWARVAAQHDPRSRAKYAALRLRGHSHARALRSVGDRLLNVACAMLRNGTQFNPSLESQKNAC
jgi:transposase